jgi:hypothetical protein
MEAAAWRKASGLGRVLLHELIDWICHYLKMTLWNKEQRIGLDIHEEEGNNKTQS